MPVVADFVQRAASTLRQEAPQSWNRGDREMQNNAQFLADGVVPKHAAVLVGLVPRRGELYLLLTQRHAGLKAHAGQIAFPGGRIDEGETPLQAALREAHEETGQRNNPVGYYEWK